MCVKPYTFAHRRGKCVWGYQDDSKQKGKQTEGALGIPEATWQGKWKFTESSLLLLKWKQWWPFRSEKQMQEQRWLALLQKQPWSLSALPQLTSGLTQFLRDSGAAPWIQTPLSMLTTRLGSHHSRMILLIPSTYKYSEKYYQEGKGRDGHSRKNHLLCVQRIKTKERSRGRVRKCCTTAIPTQRGTVLENPSQHRQSINTGHGEGQQTAMHGNTWGDIPQGLGKLPLKCHVPPV